MSWIVSCLQSSIAMVFPLNVCDPIVFGYHLCVNNFLVVRALSVSRLRSKGSWSEYWLGLVLPHNNNNNYLIVLVSSSFPVLLSFQFFRYQGPCMKINCC
jgi:hypothetical protein